MTDHWQIGDIRIARVEELCSPGFAPQQQFPDYDPAIFDRFPELRDLDRIDPATGRTIASIHSWIAWIGDQIVVIDTASGNGKTRLDPKYARFHMLDTPFLDRLAAAGAAREDVTMVINTHMHVDHSGWNTMERGGEWVPTFPNARYVFGREEYRNWQPGGVTALAQPEGVPVLDDSVTPVIGAAEVIWIDDGDTILPGVTAHALPGHTSGHLGIRVASRGDVGWFSGDVMHRAMQVFDPDLNCFLCENNAVAPLTRRRFLDTCAAEGAMVFPAHFDRPHAGRIRRRPDGGFALQGVPATPATIKDRSA
jgi:glyoxylase-like metal-dependent hydrolase (beta-lactamase superfamily II)